MRNETIAQFDGSKVTHLPVSNGRTLCGRELTNDVWATGYYGVYGEITCKTCTTRIPRDAQYNRFTSPYRHAKAGEDGPMVFAHNLDDTLVSKGVRENNPKCTYTWLPSKDGDANGLLVEWYEALGMWTVWEWNGNAPYLRQYQVGYDYAAISWGVFDKDTREYVGHTATSQGAAIMARKMNNA